ncbi:hypothetical protein BpHYR1_010892, partial [Brachionus plicatilis]
DKEERVVSSIKVLKRKITEVEEETLQETCKHQPARYFKRQIIKYKLRFLFLDNGKIVEKSMRNFCFQLKKIILKKLKITKKQPHKGVDILTNLDYKMKKINNFAFKKIDSGIDFNSITSLIHLNFCLQIVRNFLKSTYKKNQSHSADFLDVDNSHYICDIKLEKNR